MANNQLATKDPALKALNRLMNHLHRELPILDQAERDWLLARLTQVELSR